jgi:DNA-directed RNA polymerase specialized sigma24 family protein
MQRERHVEGWCHVTAVGAGQKGEVVAPTDFEDFYRTEFPSLVRAMFLLVMDVDEAQELAQEAIVRVYERWDRVSAMTSPGGYLYRVARNLNRRRIRSLAVRARRRREPCGLRNAFAARRTDRGDRPRSAVPSLLPNLLERSAMPRLQPCGERHVELIDHLRDRLTMLEPWRPDRSLATAACDRRAFVGVGAPPHTPDGVDEALRASEGIRGARGTSRLRALHPCSALPHPARVARPSKP